MLGGAIRVHVAEARHLGAKFLAAHPEWSSPFDLPLECNFCSGHEANGNIWLPDRAEPTGDRMLETRRHQALAHFRWARSQVTQAIIAHGRISSLCPQCRVMLSFVKTDRKYNVNEGGFARQNLHWPRNQRLASRNSILRTLLIPASDQGTPRLFCAHVLGCKPCKP